MLTLGSLAFATPLALTALIVLPGIWWLLRVTPPKPINVAFPPLRFLASLASSEQSAARTPLWLIALRLLLALAVICGAAHPLINTGGSLSGAGPLVLLVDDGWAAARDWRARQTKMIGLIDLAEREKKSVVLVTTARASSTGTPSLVRQLSTGRARELVRSLEPKPWSTDRQAAVTELLAVGRSADWLPGEVAWLSDGLDETGPGKSASALAESVRKLGKVRIYAPAAIDVAMALQPPSAAQTGLSFAAARAAASHAAVATLRALSEDGDVLAAASLSFAEGERQGTGTLDLPAELLARLQKVEIEGEDTAGAVVLIDERWHRRPVGLVAGADAVAHQPLLGDLYYLERGLSPFAEVRVGEISKLLERELAVLILVDVGRLDRATRLLVADWVENGGVLVQFAGPRLARSADVDDPLLPVRLRAGDRAIGGALSWRDPATMAPFDRDSPFFGLKVADDVRIRRQVLVEPTLDSAHRVWARLVDGTPLVSATRRGDGWLALVHVTANTDWSNLPLSGLFVDMLERIIALSRGAVSHAAGPPLAPVESLDGFGRLGPPLADARSIAGDAFSDTGVGPDHPPGFYGGAEHRRALNLSRELTDLRALGAFPEGIQRVTYGGATEIDLRPWLLGAALFLAVVDLAVSLVLRGLLRLPGQAARRRAITGAALVVFVTANAGPIRAQTIVADDTAVAASLTTHLAFIRTGDARTDATSRAGLEGLTAIVNRRTAVELGPPVGVNPESDELAFFPLLYWPLIDGVELPPPAALRNLEAYMRNGGTILFDTRNPRGRGRQGGFGELARELEIPPLVPVPEDHVLGRAYYLLGEFPGRWTGGSVWVERGGEHVNDGVTSVIAGSHDWAGAWAIDDANRPMFAVVPGGETQREMAYRFGVNVIMHILTGSYKDDQVHLPSILERLGK